MGSHIPRIIHSQDYVAPSEIYHKHRSIGEQDGSGGGGGHHSTILFSPHQRSTVATLDPKQYLAFLEINHSVTLAAH